MTDENPQTSQPESNEILEELREMAKNLRQALQSAWDSEERKRLQQDIEDGLKEVGNSLSQAADDFGQTPTGKKVKTEVDDLKERIRTGEVEARMREDVLKALRLVNEELSKVGKQDE